MRWGKMEDGCPGMKFLEAGVVRAQLLRDKVGLAMMGVDEGYMGSVDMGWQRAWV